MGQWVYLGKQPFMFIFFNRTGNTVSVLNVAIGPIKKEGMSLIYDLLHGGLSKRFLETKENVFNVGNGYHAFLDEGIDGYGIQILKARKSAVQ